MRASILLACSAVLLLGCDRRGYAPVPHYPGYSPVGAYGGYPAGGRAGWGTGGAPAYGAPQTPSSPGHYAAQVAMSFQGRPYCWGGTGPDCFDCSGLTLTAWRAAGRSLPRTSEEQREKLTPVAMHEVQPGDILWRPGHVGMYVGNGWAIHAPGTGKPVQYQPASKFVEARRPW